MNANQLWAGNDYAVVEGRGRGQTYYDYATRIRVIKVIRERDFGSERHRAMVEAFVVDEDGSPKKSYAGTELIKTYRARDVIMRWDEYEQERDYRRNEKERLNREALEREQKDQDAKIAIMDALESRGIERTAVSTISNYSVSINRAILESWLGLDGRNN